MKQKRPNNNFLIEYTKWLFKWVFFFSLIGLLCFGGFLVYYDYKANPPKTEDKTLIVVECEIIKNDKLKIVKKSEVWKKAPEEKKEEWRVAFKKDYNQIGYKNLMKIKKKHNDEYDIPSTVFFIPKSVDSLNYNPLKKSLLPDYKLVSYPPYALFNFFEIKDSFDTYIFNKTGSIEYDDLGSFWTWDRKTLTRKHYSKVLGKSAYLVRECKKVSESLFNKTFNKFKKDSMADYQI